MPLGDISEQANVIGAYFGGVSANVPATFDLALWAGDYYGDGVEFDYTGYERQSITNDTTGWTIDTTLGTSTASATFPDATAAATTDDADRWVLFNHDTGDVAAWEFLDEPISVDEAGSIEAVTVVIYNPNADVVDAAQASSSSSSSSSFSSSSSSAA